MEEKKRTAHNCCVCTYYTPFYVKKDTCFEKQNNGYCNNCKQIKDHFETCDGWRAKLYWWLGRKWTTERVLKELLFHLTALSQILQEDEDEKNKNKR